MRKLGGARSAGGRAGTAAVPDVSAPLRSATVRGAWSLARRSRAHAWDTAVVVRCAGDPAVQVPVTGW